MLYAIPDIAQRDMKWIDSSCNLSNSFDGANMRLYMMIWSSYQIPRQLLIPDTCRGSDNMDDYQKGQSMENYQEEKAIMHDMDKNYQARGMNNILDSSPEEDPEASDSNSENHVADQQSSNDNGSPNEENLSNGHSPSRSSHVDGSDSSNDNEYQEEATAMAEREIITTVPPCLEAMRKASKMLREAHRLLFLKQENSDNQEKETEETFISPDSPISLSSNEPDDDSSKAKSLLRQAIRLLEKESRQIYEQKTEETHQTVQPAETTKNREPQDAQMEEVQEIVESEDHRQAGHMELNGARETAEPKFDAEEERKKFAIWRARHAELVDEIREKRLREAAIASDDEKEFGER